MSNYQARFDPLLAEANSAVSNNGSAIRERIPGMHANHVRRLLSRMSKVLGLIDKGAVQNPEYLAGSPLIYPERAIEVVSRVPSSFANGVDGFLQDTLPLLVQIDEQLVRAVGIKAHSITDIKNAQVRQIDQIADWAQQRNSEAASFAAAAEKAKDGVSSSVDELKALVATVSTDKDAVAKIRTEAEKLARGNPRQNKLEDLVREARARDTEISNIQSRSLTNEQKAAQSAAKSKEAADKAEAFLAGLEKSDKKADAILRNATQAGLAGAYKTEREHLASEQWYFAIGFYSIVGAIILYAAFFLLPIFKDIFALENQAESTKDSALLLLVRLAILSPVIWALVFTNRRYRYLETLQMDYAAKATTALAYSGYIDEVKDDPDLSRQLKDGLILRFLEHPSRLLGDKKEIDVSRKGPDGVSVFSQTASQSSKDVQPVTELE